MWDPFSPLFTVFGLYLVNCTLIWVLEDYPHTHHHHHRHHPFFLEVPLWVCYCVEDLIPF